MYIDNRQIYKLNGPVAHKSCFSNNFNGAISEYKGGLHSERYDFEDFLDGIMEAFKNDYHMKWKDLLAHPPVEFKYLEILAKIFINCARQNQFIHECVFNNAPVR